ncbi:magnesium transporter CorA family protein [Candidatus Nomurabacteria bacterium]|nr:magnesium transporter CorA family protein [Candidatus Nomurabacteria bacterium]
MISKYTYNDITWVDLQSPSEEEVAHLVEEFNIPPFVAEEFVSETVRSKVDVYSNLIYLILHFPTAHEKRHLKTEQEIDFVIGKNFLITIHYELVNPLNDFFKKLELNSLNTKKNNEDHAGYLFYHIVKELYKNVASEIEKLHPEMRSIERDIFAGKEKTTVKKISEVNRKLLDFKQAMRFHNQTLRSFESAGKKFFDNNFNYYLEDIASEYQKIMSMLENHKDLLTDLRETNDSLLSTKTNETIKTLTIITFLIAPATLISSIFMMNTDFSLIQNTYEFYAVLGAMLLSSIIAFIYFKLKKWL